MAFKLLVCALYISLRVCILMCTPGKKGMLLERRGVLCSTPLPPLGETLVLSEWRRPLPGTSL